MYETGVAGDDEVRGAEEDQRPVEREAPDVGGVVEVDAAGGAEEVCQVEGGEGRRGVAGGNGGY